MSRALLLSAAAWLGCALVARSAEAAAPTTTQDPCAHTRCGTLSTIVRRAGVRAPVASARVLVIPERSRNPGEVPRRHHLQETDGSPPWVRQAMSAEDGTLVVPDVPLGRVRIIVVADGYERLERVIDHDMRRSVPPLFARALQDNPYRTVVARSAAEATPPPEPIRRDLQRDEIATLPGSQGDVLRAVQNLPGVARAPAGAGLLVLRGAPPGQSRVWVGEHPVPRAFHILGLSSVVPADLLEGLEVVPGNYSPRYGDALGGVVVLHPRKARRDGVHGFAKIDITSAGAMIEAPVGRGGIMVAAQRGYVDAVLRLVEQVDDTAVFALPRWYDYQAQYDRPLRGGAEIVARVVGSGDQWTQRTIDFEGNREEALDVRDQFHRADLEWRVRRGPWRLLLSPSFRVEAFGWENDRDRARFRQFPTSWRAEAERRMTRRVSLTFGVDGWVSPHRYTEKHTPQFEGDLQRDETTTGVDANVGVYGWATMIFGPVTLWPGVRVSSAFRQAESSMTTRKTHAFAVDPRLVARIEPHERWTVNLGIGLFSQAQSATGSRGVGTVGSEGTLGDGVVILPAPVRAALDPSGGGVTLNTAEPMAQAVHASAGVGWHDEKGLEIDATGFVRSHTELRTVYSSLDGGYGFSAFPFDADVTTYGLELLVRKRLADKLYAWAAYTLMRSQVDREATPVEPEQTLAGAYDQRHNLVLVASYELPRRFRIGGRFRLVSGSPYTPVVGALSNGYFIQPLYGAPNSKRFPLFHQLDIRVDKRWILRRAMVLAYIDVQNVYNAQNVEAYIYAQDFSRRVGSVGLPILPTIGIRVDW